MLHTILLYAEARLDFSLKSMVVKAPLHIWTEAFKGNA